mgnify:CR=1 FL=1
MNPIWCPSSQRDYDLFWHERMTLLVPQELIHHLFPWVAGFAANINKASGFPLPHACLPAGCLPTTPHPSRLPACLLPPRRPPPHVACLFVCLDA